MQKRDVDAKDKGDNRIVFDNGFEHVVLVMKYNAAVDEKITKRTDGAGNHRTVENGQLLFYAQSSKQTGKQ